MMYLLSLCVLPLALCEYPFTTPSGAPKCEVPSCDVCVSDTVEYSPKHAYKSHRHVYGGDAFYETDLAGECCGPSACHGSGNVQRGYGDCWKADGGHGDCGFLGICQDDRCHCRRLSYETIPHECQKCERGWGLTSNLQCEVCDHDHYGPDGKVCIPIDRCTDGTHTCDTNAQCSYEGPNLFSCECNSGFEGNGFGCTPIDNCKKGTDDCDTHAVCTSTGPATHTCTCNKGYKGDGQYCRDIDECVEVNNVCQTHEFCVNTAGDYDCLECHEHCALECRGGGADECDSCHSFQDGKFCVDECPLDTYPDDNGHCQQCHGQCRNGCTGEGPTKCVECAHVQIDDGTCVQQCEDTQFVNATSHVCINCSHDCEDGSFLLSACGLQDDRVCQECDKGHECTNQQMAVCPPGFFQNETGKSNCKECPVGTVAPGVEGFGGATQCLQCPKGLTSDHNRTECVQINECAQDPELCEEGFKCVDALEGYECIDPTIGLTTTTSPIIPSTSLPTRPSTATVATVATTTTTTTTTVNASAALLEKIAKKNSGNANAGPVPSVSEESMSTTTIALIGVGSLLAIVLIGIAVYCCVKSNKKKQDARGGKHAKVPQTEGHDWMNAVPSDTHVDANSQMTDQSSPSYVREEALPSNEIISQQAVMLQMANRLDGSQEGSRRSSNSQLGSRRSSNKEKDSFMM